MRRYDIGETFEENGVEIICVPASVDCGLPAISCKGCVFSGRGMIWCAHIACTEFERDDRVQAHFKAVKDMDAKTLELVKLSMSLRKEDAK